MRQAGLCAVCTGHPGGMPNLDYDPEAPAGLYQSRIDLNLQTSRDIAKLWSSHLNVLTLQLPPAPCNGSQLLLVKALPNLEVLTVNGSESVFPWFNGSPGLRDDLAFLEGKADLQSVRLYEHMDLTCITHLRSLTSLTSLTLVWTGVTQWLDVMSTLTSLRCLNIERSTPDYKEFSHCEYDIHSRVFLRLSSSFFHSQPDLQDLSLNWHVLMLDQVESFQSLTAMTTLDLGGCSIMGFRPGGGEVQMMSQFSVKPLQGLISLEELYLSSFAPYTGGWTGMQNGLCDLGVTCMTALSNLDLSGNRLETVPRHLSALSALTHLDLSRNLLHPDCLMDPAIVSLSQLESLWVNNCMAECLTSATQARISYRHHFAHNNAFGGFADFTENLENRNRAANAAGHAKAVLERLYELPDLGRLMQACPNLEELRICIAA